MLKEFKAFILRGNLIELAVAFVLGVAFAAVVGSFVADIITPMIGAIFHQPDFSRLHIDIGRSAIAYGRFLNALLTFLIVAVVMFAIVQLYNRAIGVKAATTKECPFCLTKVPLGARRCAACTSELLSAPSTADPT